MNVDRLEPAAREALLAGARAIRLQRGAVAYAAGDRAELVYAIRSGRVKLVRTTAGGSEVIVGIRTAGEIFGELSGSLGRPRTTSAVAMEPVEAAAIPAVAFAAALERDVALARAFARGVAHRLGAAELELAELSGKSVPGRLVDALGRLAADHGVTEPGGAVRIGINLTHKDLADLIGTSRETLTKELGVLAEVGLLRVAHKTITLVQPRAFPFAQRAARSRRPAETPQ